MRLRRALPGFLLIAACWPMAGSCKSSAPSYPFDDVLTLWHAQVKATHNSYHVKTTDGVVEWDYTMSPLDVQLAREGVRSVELDANYDADTDKLEVYHLSLVDEGTTCRAFRDCLLALRRWSDANPRHLPLYIQIEPK